MRYLVVDFMFVLDVSLVPKVSFSENEMTSS